MNDSIRGNDECTFTQADEGMCSSHNLPAALCTHAAAELESWRKANETTMLRYQQEIDALQARVREAESDHAAVCAEWSAAMREIERLTDRVRELEDEIEEMKDDAKYGAWERDLI